MCPYDNQKDMDPIFQWIQYVGSKHPDVKSLDLTYTIGNLGNSGCFFHPERLSFFRNKDGDEKPSKNQGDFT